MLFLWIFKIKHLGFSKVNTPNCLFLLIIKDDQLADLNLHGKNSHKQIQFDSIIFADNRVYFLIKE